MSIGSVLGVPVILDRRLRDLWYEAYEQLRGRRRGLYAYGAKGLKVQRTPNGYRVKGQLLPLDTPVYAYGHETSGVLDCPRGPYIFRCQLPGFQLPAADMCAEERLYPLSDKTMKRSQSSRLRVRCGGSSYRIVELNRDPMLPFCYVFGTNILLSSHRVPLWMRRRRVVFPHPRRSVRRKLKSRAGDVYYMGRPKRGRVFIAGIEMQCTKIDQLCSILYLGRKYYAHKSVVFTEQRESGIKAAEGVSKCAASLRSSPSSRAAPLTR